MISRVYRNCGGGVFTNIDAALMGAAGTVAWGDYDNDGDLDILLRGTNREGHRFSRVHRNDGTPPNAPPDPPDGLSTTVLSDSVTLRWNAASDAQTPSSGLTYNVRIGTTPGGGEVAPSMADPANGFRRVATLGNAQKRTSWTFRLPVGSYYWSAQALDGAYAGSSFPEDQAFEISVPLQRFTDIAAGLPGTANGAWVDYDNDGDLDLLLPAFYGDSRVYRNDGGGLFTKPAAAVGGDYAVWGDYDNDGDLDILLTGPANNWQAMISRLYRSDVGGVFTDIGAELPGVRDGSVAWGDYDNDGDLDLALLGWFGDVYSGGLISRVYRNDGTLPNTHPAAPTDLSAWATGDQLTLSWTAPVPGTTPVSGLSYNLRVGTTSGGSEIMPAMAHSTSGYRRVVQLGNAQQRTSWTITAPPGTYYWSVQAVDGTFAGSPFAEEAIFSPSSAVESLVPTRTALQRGFPNPFAGATAIGFDLATGSRVRLEVFDVSGRRVRTLVDEVRPAGRYATTWNGADERGMRLAGGVYYCRMVAGKFRATRPMTLIR